jgi:transcriptional regulator with XRE-family HTH domain
MSVMKLAEYREQLQHDPDYRAAEEELRPLLDLADAVIALRLARGWSQAELAERVGTKQANISRLESGLANPGVKFLQKLASALGETLTIQLRPGPTLSSIASTQRGDRIPARHYPRAEPHALPAIRERSADWLVNQTGDSELALEASQDEPLETV